MLQAEGPQARHRARGHSSGGYLVLPSTLPSGLKMFILPLFPKSFKRVGTTLSLTNTSGDQMGLGEPRKPGPQRISLERQQPSFSDPLSRLSAGATGLA